MRSQLLAGVAVNLRFYRRNRLLWVIAIVLALLASVNVVLSLFMYSDTQRFMQLTQVFSTLNQFAFVFSSMLGLFVVSSHLRDKSLTIVLTKPCPPEKWLAACFVSATLVTFALYGLILVLVLAGSLGWGLPLQSGFVYGAAREFLVATIALAYLLLLATALHPVAAVIVAIVLQEKSFFGLKFLLMARLIDDVRPHVWVRGANWLVSSIYYVVPMLDPYSAQATRVYSSMRVEGGDWIYLAYTAMYALSAGTFFYLGSTWILRRRSLV